jgi:high-affinity Fe2+/Pb2+ permease
MDPLFIIAIICGITLVFLLFAARIALRWAIRLVAVGALLLIVLGGAWWWFSQSSTQPENKPRPTTGRSANSNRR